VGDAALMSDGTVYAVKGDTMVTLTYTQLRAPDEDPSVPLTQLVLAGL
jgi:hypothetical protein